MKKLFLIGLLASAVQSASFAQWADSGINLTTTDNVSIKSSGTDSNPVLDFKFYSGGGNESAVRNYTTGDRRNIEFSMGYGSWRFRQAGDFNIVSFNGSNYYDSFVIKAATGTILIGQTASRATAGKYKLDVLGGVRANSVVVNTDGADFVFAKTYRLRPLSEVESFIQANHHLPEIAPAAEMQKEGVSIGELQTQLLQKIEELTLYMIEQNKKVEEQDKQLQELKKENEELKKEMSKLTNH